jgi:hypothetical protein
MDTQVFPFWGAQVQELVFRKSSRSNDQGLCVEVATPTGHGSFVRDSKDYGQGPTLAFGREAWAAFVRNVPTGD